MLVSVKSVKITPVYTLHGSSRASSGSATDLGMMSHWCGSKKTQFDIDSVGVSTRYQAFWSVDLPN